MYLSPFYVVKRCNICKILLGLLVSALIFEDLQSGHCCHHNKKKTNKLQISNSYHRYQRIEVTGHIIALSTEDTGECRELQLSRSRSRWS